MSYISAETQGNNVVVWERVDGIRSCRIQPADWNFYVEHKNGKHKNIYGEPLKKLSFKNQFDFYNAKKEAKMEGYKLYDSDVSPDLKYVSQHYAQKEAPKLNISFYDIEIDSDMTKVFRGALEPIYPITAISLSNRWNNKSYVLAVPPPEWDPEENPLDEDLYQLSEILLYANEKELLKSFLNLIEDCDCLVGYNSDGFDDPYVTCRVRDILGTKYLKQLSFKEGKEPIFKLYTEMGQDKIRVMWSGRTQSDYMQLIRKFEPGERQSYALASIAQEYLPHLPKLSFSGNLEQLYHDDFSFFVRYSIRDTEILNGLEDKLGYVEVANMLRFGSSGYMSHVGGTVKLADLAVRNFCWYDLEGTIGHDFEDKGPNDGVEGAYVMDPVVGYHKNIISVDITSLYPSNIMMLNASPEKLIGQFLLSTEAYRGVIDKTDKSYTFQYDRSKEYSTKTGAEWYTYFRTNNMSLSGYGTAFSLEGFGIFPSILRKWFAQRVEYKRLMKAAINGEIQQYYDRLQYIMKILLNSFYGALLNAFFRYFDKRLGASVTGSGREVLTHQASIINQLSGGVYSPFDGATKYGDTDSFFASSRIMTSRGEMMIEDMFDDGYNFVSEQGKEYVTTDRKVLTYCNEQDVAYFGEVEYIYRHKVSKACWEVEDEDGNILTITNDHSIMIERDGILMEIKACDINIDTDLLITLME